MKTAEKNAGTVPGTAAKTGAPANTQNRPNLTGKEAKQDEPTKNSEPAPAAQAAPASDAEAKIGSPAAVDHQPAHPAPETAAPEVKPEAAAEPAKGETAAQAEPKKLALNLEQTLKSVNDLHRLSIQRLALIGRIKTLEDFEVQLQQESDELESNPYQGCKLIIEDDHRRQFVTNTPNLIRMVAQFLFDACYDKLAEIEANIVFPNA